MDDEGPAANGEDPARARRRFGAPAVLGGAVAVTVVLALVWVLVSPGGSTDTSDARPAGGSSTSGAPATSGLPTSATTASTVTTAPPTTAPPPTTTRPAGAVDPTSSGRPFPNATTKGLLTFRGNPTRSWYGTGPMPRQPQVLWSYPSTGGMCGESDDGTQVATWCGTGWNGQPSVWEYDGRTWVAFGAYDYGVHFVDATDGKAILPPLRTGDLAKGTVTVDPDGFPLLYHGSRDNKLRVIAFDRDQPVVLWSLDAYAAGTALWNNDWDASPLVLDDYLFQGGENSRLHIVKLNRSLGPDGKVRVAPELVWSAPGWDDELLSHITDRQVSIESSVAISGTTMYVANSGGLVQGWDIGGLRDGVAPTRTFRFWTGDDTDATIAVDAEGFLYVGSEWERHNERSRVVGQIMKLDPRRPDDPLVWSIPDQGAGIAGIWATPALHRDMVYVATNGGRLLGIARADGTVRWRKQLTGPTWQSPVVVDDVLVQGDCSGVLRGYDVRDTTIDPPLLWSVTIGGCIESTPAVWNGRIYVGTRAGRVHAIGDR